MATLKKCVSTVCAFLFLTSLLTSCSQQKTGSESSALSSVPGSSHPSEVSFLEKATVRLGVLPDSSGIGAAGLMDKSSGGLSLNQYEIALFSSPEEIKNELLAGKLDIAALPTNMAAQLYHDSGFGMDLQMIAIHSLGMLHIVTENTAIHSLSDLKGKTVYVAEQDGVSPLILESLLKKNRLTPFKDVLIESRASSEEVASLLVSGDAEIALLPEPAASSAILKKEGLTRAIDLSKEWKTVNPDTDLAMGCLVVTKDFALENPQAITSFLVEYEESVKAAQSDPATTAELCARHHIMESSIAAQALPYSGLTFLSGSAMQAHATGFFTVLLQSDPKSIGGSLPDSSFYLEGESSLS